MVKKSKQPGKILGQTRRNWAPIRRSYVEGIIGEDGNRTLPSLAKIAELFGLSVSVVSHKAHDEKWTVAREDFQRKLDVTTREKKIELLAKEAIDFDLQCLQLARAGIAQVVLNFRRLERRRALDPDAVLEPKEVATLGRALAQYQVVGHLSMGTAQGEAKNPVHITTTTNDYRELSMEEIKAELERRGLPTEIYPIPLDDDETADN